MQRYIAFLSGLPTGDDSVGMDTLRSLFSRLGYLEVDTFLTTDNVAFLTAPVGIIPPLEAQISRFLSKHIRDEIGVFIRTPDELTEIAENNPVDRETAASSGTFVVLLHELLPKAIEQRLSRISGTADRFHARGREIYWQHPSRSVVPLKLSTLLEVPATVRSFNTIKRLAAKYADDLTGSARSRR